MEIKKHIKILSDQFCWLLSRKRDIEFNKKFNLVKRVVDAETKAHRNSEVAFLRWFLLKLK